MRTPWHYWFIVALGFLWHAFGVADYLVTQYQFAPWMALMNDAQGLFVTTLPAWVEGAWAITVFAGLLGVILMAFRAALAPLMLGISAIALIALTIWAFWFPVPSLYTATGWTGHIVLGGAVIGSLILWLYARRMHRVGLID